MKKCKECETILKIGENIAESSIKARNYLCRNCASKKMRLWREENPKQALDRELSSRYGISYEEYKMLLLGQQNTCAFCDKPPGVNPRQKRLCVDHCHETGKIRFLLCDKCNRALGMLGDTKKAIMKVIAYLERPDARELARRDT